MSINLNLDGLRERAKCIKEEEVVQETGHEVKLLLHFPDGTTELVKFTMGTLVSYVKAFIQTKHGLPMTQQVLRLDDKLLIDPLCLSDIPEINVNDVNNVKVLVN